MLRNREMVLDMSEVKRRMADLNLRILPGRIRRGLTIAGNRLMVATVVEEPTAPIKRGGYGGSWGTSEYGPTFTRNSFDNRVAGELRASGALFVDGVKKRTTVRRGEFATGRYQPFAYGGAPILPGSHEACIVFNAPYAAEQHEQWPSKTEPGAGMRYLSTKLYGHAIEYIGIVAEAVRL